MHMLVDRVNRVYIGGRAVFLFAPTLLSARRVMLSYRYFRTVMKFVVACARTTLTPGCLKTSLEVFKSV